MKKAPEDTRTRLHVLMVFGTAALFCYGCIGLGTAFEQAVEESADSSEQVEQEEEEKGSEETVSQGQAVKKAERYLEYSAFLRSGLIEQLEFKGFSNEQATYAVDQVGL